MSKEDKTSSKKKLGRPTKDHRIAVNMRLPSKLLEKLRVEAAEKDRSVTSIIVELLQQRYNPDGPTS
ncbi:Arc family DNA-binding protein [Neolewinella persica]|uniref:Arc family DNA-binding protein n=1 Tax=Neolewinella persica TaxID=70998 RepID=UPI000367B3E8|nr:Arc family DNA-binding protein [Neolewinella persica]